MILHLAEKFANRLLPFFDIRFRPADIVAHRIYLEIELFYREPVGFLLKVELIDFVIDAVYLALQGFIGLGNLVQLGLEGVF